MLSSLLDVRHARPAPLLLQSVGPPHPVSGQLDGGMLGTGGGDLSSTIGAMEEKVPAVSSDFESEAKLSGAKTDLKRVQSDRTAAEEAMAQATILRGKEAATQEETQESQEESLPSPHDARTQAQKEADECKTVGNDLYKKKKFKDALAMYDKAIEKEPNDLVYYYNKCAVWLEMGEQYHYKILEVLADKVQRRDEIASAYPGGATPEKFGKIFGRMAQVHHRRALAEERLQEYDACIWAYKKSLLEDDNKATRAALQKAERDEQELVSRPSRMIESLLQEGQNPPKKWPQASLRFWE